MTTETALDSVHAAMQAGGDPERLAFYRLLADTELILWLEEEVSGEAVSPRILETDGSSFVLAFDTEDRLADLAGQAVPRLGLSGRALAHLLAGQNVGLALNMGDAPSAILLPPEAMVWLVDTLNADVSAETDAQPVAFAAADAAHSVAELLAEKLAPMAGQARAAYLATARYRDGSTGLFIAIVDAPEQAEQALRGAVREAVVFSGLDQGALDLAFLSGTHPALAALAPVALRLDLSAPPAPQAQIVPPGLDPDKPPRLR